MENIGLISKANKFLDDTIELKEILKEERKLIYFLLENKEMAEVNDVLKNTLNICYNSSKLKQIKKVMYDENRNAIRKEDEKNIEDVTIFSTKDDEDKQYIFLTRKSAIEYIQKNKENFTNINIEVNKIANTDIEKIANILNSD